MGTIPVVGRVAGSAVKVIPGMVLVFRGNSGCPIPRTLGGSLMLYVGATDRPDEGDFLSLALGDEGSDEGGDETRAKMEGAR